VLECADRGSDAAWDTATGVAPWSRDCSVNYTVTPVAAPNGEIFPGTPQLAGVNGGASFAIVPNAGYGVVVGGNRPTGNGRATPTASASSTPAAA
jgi:hypothetical protein